MKIKEISLYYKDGSSDKEYHAQIEQEATGYVVNFQYGRRGSTLTAGTKTKAPIDLAQAEKTYATLIKEKTSKGYTEGVAGATFTYQDLGDRVTGIVPQLLNNMKDSELTKHLSDPDWIMQEKYDGRRLMVSFKNSEFTAINKKGLSIITHDGVKKLIESIKKDVVVDGEIVGDNYYIFDLLEYDGKNFRELTVIERYQQLLKIKLLNKNIVKTSFTTKEKTEHFKDLEENKKEGAVFKKVNSQYTAGRPSSGGNQLKYKFWESATVEVISHHKTKRSVGVCVYNNNERYELGNITIPSNYSIPNIGDIVEVIYLYCNIGGLLYQTKYKGVRDDQDKNDCSYSQLKFKAKNDDDDDEIEESNSDIKKTTAIKI